MVNIARLIDYALLKAEATNSDIARFCAEARKFGFWSACVNPSQVRSAAAALAGSGIKVCTVVGFPLGASLTEDKVYETRVALRDGATEIDMVLNLGEFKSGEAGPVLEDIQAVVHACRESSALCKVILETSSLTDTEKARACELCVKAGADFVKTSTGFGRGGARVEDVAMLSRLVKPRGLGVTAAGGIRTLVDLQKMLAAGATRIGTSSGVKILQEAAGA